MQTVDQLLNLDPTSLALVVLRTLVVYGVLLVLFRVFGKRELGQMEPFDLVVLLIIANAVQNAMVGPDTSLSGGLLAALTLLLVNRLIGQVSLRYPRLHRLITGSATPLVQDGVLIQENLNREGITEEDLMQAAREHGIGDLADVQLAELEVDGTISIVPREGATTRRRTPHRIRGRKPTG